jgi:formate dehydrogenase iron-sulfur subunit
MAQTVGFFTDTTLCIGCKACEVACKEWNQLPGHAPRFGDGYDNTGQLDEQNWRYVQFHERTTAKGGVAWNMMSDVCKHCTQASCMEVCPTNAIIRTEFDTVYIQPDVCNGCRDCIAACPYHVIGYDEQSGLARKCTFCYDRLQKNLVPACAKACPTESIKFGDLSTMRDLAGARLNQLRGQGMSEARLYGDKEYGGLHALFLLTDAPEAYRLPNAANAVLPSRNNLRGYLGSLATAVLALVGAVVAFRERGENKE